MKKMKMHSPNLTQENIDYIRKRFPGCVAEARGTYGKLKLSVDFDQLRQELSESIVEGAQERYHLDWPGKREALLTANTPITTTLRPRRKESVDFGTTKNLFVEGDNLEVLKMLQETYLGKVKMIYIDPPYNTGNDFIYRDDFTISTADYVKESKQVDKEGKRLVASFESSGRFHSDWLCMMYPRLRLARNMLRDDGVIFISVDDNEQSSLKKLCNEIFGESNFLACVVWQRVFSPKNDAKHLSTNHDYILIYSKDCNVCKIGKLPRTKKADDRYKNLDNDHRGNWVSGDLTVKTYSEKYDYPITTSKGRVVNPAHGSCWRVSKERFQELVDDNRIWFGEDGSTVPRLKRFLSEVQPGMVPTTLWTHQEVGHNQEGRQELKALFDGKGYFDGPKPVRLISRIIQLANFQDHEICLDFFAGSSTTAHAVMKLNAEDGYNRKFIMVQLPEVCDQKTEAAKTGYATIAEISKERIRRAGKKVLEGECHVGWDKDIGFRVLKVDSSNMKDVYYTPGDIDQGQLKTFTDNIKPDREPEDLLFHVLLDWGVNLSLPIRKETIQGKTVFFVDENALVACFDTGVDEKLVKELARIRPEPLRVVFRDSGFVSDSVKINVEQFFKQMSPSTVVKTI